jgi:hypothetical protein
VKRGGSLSFLVGTISNVLVMEIGWIDVGSGGYILFYICYIFLCQCLLYMFTKSFRMLNDNVIIVMVYDL